MIIAEQGHAAILQAATELELAVVIPTLNERDNIVPLVNALRAVVPVQRWEIIFVDDGSTDGTLDVIRSLALVDPSVRLIRRYGRRGLSSAVIEGALASVAPVFAVIDADMQHDEAALPALLSAVASGADVAVGTRYALGGSVGEWSRGRQRISQLATRLTHLLLKAPVSDPMSGFFVCRRAVLEAALPRLSTAGFKILLDILASHPTPVAVVEVPYTFRTRHAGESKLDASVSIEFVLMLLDKLVGGWLPPRFVMFMAVGGIGLGVHLAMLTLLLNFVGFEFRLAQGGAVLAAMTGNFLLNNALTYRDRRLGGWRLLTGLLSFFAVCSIGAAANVGVGELIYLRGQQWWIAGIAGAVVGAVWNYTASSLFTWKKG